ncbi:MAG: MMPL family transporter [Longimicrobiales bacterium]|nr:MMPL family transporter [Longimicrobiales bacterium]
MTGAGRPHACELAARRPTVVLLVALVATIVGGILTSRLGIESDLAALLPDDFPSVVAVDQMEAEVGGSVSTLQVALISDDFDAMLRLAEELQPRFQESERVLYARFRNEFEFYDRNALLFLAPAELDSLRTALQDAIDEEKQALNPFMVDDLFGPPPDEEEETEEGGLDAWEARYTDAAPRPYLTDADSSVLVIEIAAAQDCADLDFCRAMAGDVRAIVEAADPTSYAPDMEVLYGGNVMNRIGEFTSLRRDIIGTAGYGLVSVSIVLLLYFRTFVAPLLIALSLIASLTWTFGITRLVIGQLNTITGFLFVVLFGLGIDYGIHAFARYREVRRAGGDQKTGLHRMVCETGRALTTTTFTTSAAFFSLALMDFRGFSELGLITGVGLIFALIAMIFVLPALIIVAERLGVLRIAPSDEVRMSFTPRPFRPARALAIVGVAITLFALVGTLRVQFQYDFTDLRFISADRERFTEVVDDVFSRSNSPALVLAETPEEARQVEVLVRELMASDTLTPTVGDVQSIYSLIPQDQDLRLEKIRGIRELIDEENARELLTGKDLERLERLERYLEVDEAVALEDVPESELRPFRRRDGEIGSFVFIYPDVALRDGRNAILFSEDIGTITLPSGEVLNAASSNLIVADLLRMVIREGRIAVFLSLFVVLAIVYFDVRRLADSLIILSPLVFGLVWLGGLMHLFGMQLNLFNIVVLPSVIGIGVDSAVHLHHRYRSEGRGSMYHVLARTGPAIAIATLTTIVGYLGLVLASHPGLDSIGRLAVLGLLATLASALFVFPALLVLVDRWRGLADSALPDPSHLEAGD